MFKRNENKNRTAEMTDTTDIFVSLPNTKQHIHDPNLSYKGMYDHELASQKSSLPVTVKPGYFRKKGHEPVDSWYKDMFKFFFLCHMCKDSQDKVPSRKLSWNPEDTIVEDTFVENTDFSVTERSLERKK